MSIVKRRLKEVAADLGFAPKEVSEVLSRFFEKPKSNSQILTDEELNVLLDYVTQQHQIDSLEQVFAVQAKPAEKKPRPQQPQEPKKPVEPAEQADPETAAGRAQTFLQELTQLMGVQVSVAVNTDEEGNVRVNMMGDEQGDNLPIPYWFGKDVDGNGFQRRPVTFQDSFFTNSNAVILVMSTPDTGWQTVEMARKHEKPLIYSYRNDPAQISHDMLRELLGETAVQLSNEAEARAIEKQFSLDHITDLFRTAKAQVIVTTLGKRGCLIYDKNSGRDYEQTLVPITSGGNGFVDAVGAGDGFVAGFLYGMSRKKPLPVCAQYGSTLASFVIECDGSTTNLPDEEALLARNQTRPDAM